MIHPTADVSPEARIGRGTRIWHEAQVCAGAVVGADCNIGKGVYIGPGVVVGQRVKIQNRASLYPELTVDDGVFIGPHVVFTNDRYPRSITPEGRLLTDADWEPGVTLVRHGASIGAGAVIICGLTIGRWALVGAGALVTHDVPDHGLVMGVPARLVGYVCECARRLEPEGEPGLARRTGGPAGRIGGRWRCPACGRSFELAPLVGRRQRRRARLTARGA
jgi:UDP-2-acetamido-3-amino-2,3-dideoxy-glucuronate N-acetyltransferase